MFILDSLMIAGIRWALETALTAAEAEMNDDSVLREQLLEAEMRREMGEISDAEFRDIEADLLARIRDIKERRDGAGPLAFGAQPLEAAGGDQVRVEASVSGDFHEAAETPHTTVVEPLPHHRALGNLVETRGRKAIAVLDMEPGDAAPTAPPPPGRRRRGSAARGAVRKAGRALKTRHRGGTPSRKSARVGRVPRSRPGKARTGRKR